MLQTVKRSFGDLVASMKMPVTRVVSIVYCETATRSNPRRNKIITQQAWNEGREDPDEIVERMKNPTDSRMACTLPNLIPLKVLFGNEDKTHARVSYDGQLMGFLGNDVHGVLNVFVQPMRSVWLASNPVGHAQQVTFERQRSLNGFVWSKSTCHNRLLYLQDHHGNEQFHLFCVDFDVSFHDDQFQVDSIRERDLTAFEHATLFPSGLHLNAKYPDQVVVEMNQRDQSVYDVSRIDLTTGKVHVELENPGAVKQWVFNDALQAVACVQLSDEDGASSIWVRPSMESTDASMWRQIGRWPHGEHVKVHSTNSQGNALYVETTLVHEEDCNEVKSTDTARLVLLSMGDGHALQEIASDPVCDVREVMTNEAMCSVDYVKFDYTRPRIEIVTHEKHTQQDLQHLLEHVKGDFALESRDKDDQVWIYSDTTDTEGVTYFVYHRKTRESLLLFATRPDIAAYTLVPMLSHVITTFDEESVVVYMSLPHGVAPQQLPFVVSVHGGPWFRDSWGYNPLHQLFANRGYGCISVNFRGSSGYGKRWMNLGDRQWGATMQQDLTDAVHWILQQGYADKDRIAIFGASYGGYATLAGLTFTPELYTCGVDVVGVSHLKTFMKSIPKYWGPVKKMLLLRVGDAENDQEFNEAHSPFHHADKICKPLMIAQGANDPRVKRNESDQMVRKLYANNREVQYVVYEDEGHGFEREPNRLDFYYRMDAFLAGHLGGRFESVDLELIKSNTAQVIDPTTL